MAGQKTTLKDIAELAGLSVSTVSRALKDDVEIAKSASHHRRQVGPLEGFLQHGDHVAANQLLFELSAVKTGCKNDRWVIAEPFQLRQSLDKSVHWKYLGSMCHPGILQIAAGLCCST